MPAEAIDYGAHAADTGGIDYGAHAPADSPPPAASKSFGDHLKEYFDQTALFHPKESAQALITAGAHPIDTAKSYSQQNNEIASKATEAYKKGDYTEAARHALHYLLNGIPGFGARLDAAADKGKNGDIGGMLADTGAIATDYVVGPKVLKAGLNAATEPDAAAKLTAPIKKVLADHPDLVKHAGTAAGAFVGHEAGVGPYIGGYLGRKAGESLSEWAKRTGGTVDPLLDQIAKGTWGKPFSALDPSDQAAATRVAAGIRGNLPDTSAAPPADPSFHVETGEPPSVPKPEYVDPRGPLRPPMNPRPPDVPGAPEPSGPVVPVKPPLKAAPPAAYLDTETTGLQGPEAASRARAAGNIATKLQAQGITEADLDALDKVPTAAKTFWEKAGGFHREGYTPSPETVDAIKDVLKAQKTLKAAPAITINPDVQEIPAYLQKNPKALAAAQAFQKAMSISDLMNQGR